ncbi:MAG TPA: polysaccharide deacetylase family protein [Desulfobacterales bacterium]|nr:polysaccharide deacetylase family protein [Desulfobacterales bacterium]
MRFLLTLLACLLVVSLPAGAASEGTSEPGVPILLYHRFGPTVADSMTVTTAVFESHLKYLNENGYTVIALRELLALVSGPGIPPAARYVVLVADDAHRSVYTDALPLIKKYRVPMTLFAYPSAISNASYAMTWDQLREVQATGLFDVQSHTYWHPNFKKEREKLPPTEFDKLVRMQLTKSREKLEKELGRKVDLLAWPFGIYDPDLMARAAAEGYAAAFTIERHPVTRRDHPMALPRYLLADTDRGKIFAAILNAPIAIAKRENGNAKED